MQLHETVQGQDFFRFQLPNLIEALEGIRWELHKANELKERELNLTDKSKEGM